MFSNLNKNNQVVVIDKTGDGLMKVGVVSDIKQQNTPYQFNPIGVPNNSPIDIVVKYEDGSEDNFPQLPPNNTVFTYNNGNVIVCDGRDSARSEIEKLHAYAKQHIESTPHYEKILASTEQMMCAIDPRYAKDLQNDADIRNLKSGMQNMQCGMQTMEGKIDNLASMMQQFMSGMVSSGKKSNN